MFHPKPTLDYELCVFNIKCVLFRALERMKSLRWKPTTNGVH